MIYKNGIKATKIELVVNEDKQNIACHVHLSNDQVYTGKPQKIDPGTFFNQTKLQTLSILTIGKTLKVLKEEIEE